MFIRPLLDFRCIPIDFFITCKSIIFVCFDKNFINFLL